MRSNHVALILALLCPGFLVLECSTPTMTAGTVTQSGNGRVAGALVTGTGTPASGTPVELFPSDFDPVIDGVVIVKDTTDSRGRYTFDGIGNGVYNVMSIKEDGKTMAAKFGVTVAGDTVVLPPDTMRMPGSIRVVLPGALDSVNGYLYVPGTTIFTRLAGTGSSAILDSVPAGVAMPVYYAVENSPAVPKVIRDSIIVAPGGIMNIEYMDWKFSKKLRLNTTASGAGITTTVTDFPVLVRLSSGNFDFSTARSGGADVRFTKSDGTALSYEIERWDASQGSAEIWVKVDTVFGDDSSHFIIMYWGNSLATSASNGAAVFDTATGLQGVWHLNDPVSGQVKDATSNGYNGTPVNVTAQSAVNAMVGVGRRLQGNDSGYIVLQGTADSKLNFQENGIYAIAAWVYIDTLDGAVHNFVSKCDQQYNLEDYVNDWEFAEYKSTKQWEMTRSPATAKTWTHVVGVRNQAKQYLFVNGLCVDSTIDIPVPTSSARNTSYPVMFGKSDGNQSSPGMPFLFHGILDEIRMLNRAPSVDWIKLCYMNQKQQDKLIEFK